jgi:hypothetical protein
MCCTLFEMHNVYLKITCKSCWASRLAELSNDYILLGCNRTIGSILYQFSVDENYFTLFCYETDYERRKIRLYFKK